MSRAGNSPLRARECAIWALVLLLIQVVNFSGFFVRGEVLAPSDLLFKIRPWSEHRPPGFTEPVNSLMYDPAMAFRPDFIRLQEALREGRWPLWNDLEMGGLPLLANCQSRVFYIPHLALRILDVDTAISCFIVCKLWLAAFVAYVCARALNFGVWPSRWFSIVWGFGCFAHIWAYWPITDVLVWAPVVFLGTEWAIERRYRKGFFALALGGTMLLFAGHPETAFAIGAYVTLYFALRLAFAWAGGLAPWRPIAIFAGAWVLATTAYASQLLPFIEYLRQSAPVEDRVDMPLTFSALSTFWVPRFFGTNAEGTFWDKNTHNANLTIQQYVGMAAWLGAAIAVANLRRGANATGPAARARVSALLIAVAASVLMAVDAPLLGWAQNLPGFSHMRTIYHVYFTLFALPLLGLIGLDTWFERPRKLRELTMTLTVLVPAATLLAGIWMYNERLIQMAGVREYVMREIGTAICIAMVSLSILAAHCLTRQRGFVWAILIAASCADVLWPVRGLNPSLRRSELPQATPLISYLQEKAKPCRVDVLGAAIAPGAAGNFDVEEWEGYDGLYPERPIRFRERLARRIWDKMYVVSSTDYYLNDPQYTELAPIGKLADRGEIELETTLDGIDVYRHVRMLPRARLVGTLEIAHNSEQLFERMLDPEFDPSSTAITESPPVAALPSGQAESPGTATLTVHRPEHSVIEVRAEQDAVLVVAENYFSGWRATVDGVDTPIFPVYYCFRGICVPKGDHVVAFRYVPSSLIAGVSMSAIALVASSGSAIYFLRRRRS
ncbi:MAG: YfhO family protein [Candidatus Hydrogenedentes bacterium]|nr:YfhO family protein [Candidatus Hydrogenedentota bacterium]